MITGGAKGLLVGASVVLICSPREMELGPVGTVGDGMLEVSRWEERLGDSKDLQRSVESSDSSNTVQSTSTVYQESPATWR